MTVYVLPLSAKSIEETSASGHLAATIIRSHGKQETEIGASLSEYLSPHDNENGPLVQSRKKGLDFLNSISIWQGVLKLDFGKSRTFL